MLIQEILYCLRRQRDQKRNKIILYVPKGNNQYKSEVRERIIESAVECFARTGFDRTKMDDIANVSDVSKGTLYLYFKSKEDSFYGICEASLKK